MRRDIFTRSYRLGEPYTVHTGQPVVSIKNYSVTEKVARLQSGLDAGDRARLGEYLDNVREIGRRIQKATAQCPL